jgi:hypothetical protein
MGGVTISERPVGAEGRDPVRTPSDILALWRATERLYAAATPGTDEAAELHAEMRRLMDEYEWRVRGSVPKRVDRAARHR